MRLLCLHGAGTNSQVLEMQLAAVRYELGDSYTFDFVEGTLDHAIASEIRPFYPPEAQYFAYFDYQSSSSIHKALSDLSTFLEIEGPYDGIIAFSHAASLVSTFIVQTSLKNPPGQLPFKFAVFISGGYAVDPRALERGEVRVMKCSENDTAFIKLPTAHIYDINDNVAPGSCNALWDICDKDDRWRFLHREGHVVPSSRATDTVTQTVRVIQRTMERGLSNQ